MAIIFQKPYSYSLYDYNNVWYLTYLSGEPLESGISIKLSFQEIERVRDNQAELELLVKEFKSDNCLYKGRRVYPVVTSQGPPGIPQA